MQIGDFLFLRSFKNPEIFGQLLQSVANALQPDNVLLQLLIALFEQLVLQLCIFELLRKLFAFLFRDFTEFGLFLDLFLGILQFIF